MGLEVLRMGGFVPGPSAHEMELERRMAKIALVASSALHDSRVVPEEEASLLRRDALAVIEKIATATDE